MKKVFLAMIAVAAMVMGGQSASADAVVYSNVTNFLGQGFANGGAALVGANTITRMVMDDIDPINSPAGALRGFSFSVANFGAAAVNARARVRFYNGNGAGGGPGTFLGGFTFNPISFNPGVTVYSAPTPTSTVVLPFTKFWAGITFDNNSGATGASAAQLNQLGVGLFNPPTIGSSADQMFLTTAAGDFLVNNPVGGNIFFNGNPVANAGWAFTTAIPEPGSAGLLCLGLIALVAKRRRLG